MNSIFGRGATSRNEDSQTDSKQPSAQLWASPQWVLSKVKQDIFHNDPPPNFECIYSCPCPFLFPAQSAQPLLPKLRRSDLHPSVSQGYGRFKTLSHVKERWEQTLLCRIGDMGDADALYGAHADYQSICVSCQAWISFPFYVYLQFCKRYPGKIEMKEANEQSSEVKPLQLGAELCLNIYNSHMQFTCTIHMHNSQTKFIARNIDF